MNIIRCESGVTCQHADFDLDAVSTEGIVYASDGTEERYNPREKKMCIPCLHAESDRRHNTGAVADARQWIKENGGIAPNFFSDHSGDYRAFGE